MRFVLVCFAFLGFAFYELSGGSDFEPRKPRAQVAEQDTAEPARTQLVAGAVQVVPDPGKVATVINADAATPLTFQQVSTKPASETPEPSLAFQITQSDTATGDAVTLASLADSDSAFPQLTFLDPNTAAAPAQTDAAAETAAEPEPAPKLDIRSVTGSRVNLRKGPGTTYGVIDTLFYDDQVEVLDTLDNGWVQLRKVGDNRIGWMTSRFVGKPVN